MKLLLGMVIGVVVAGAAFWNVGHRPTATGPATVTAEQIAVASERVRLDREIAEAEVALEGARSRLSGLTSPELLEIQSRLSPEGITRSINELQDATDDVAEKSGSVEFLKARRNNLTTNGRE